MRKNLKIVVLTAGALLIVLFLVFHQHQTSKEKVLSQFNENQLLNTHEVARSIERYFRSRSQDLRWLAYIASHQAFDKNKAMAEIQSNFISLKTTNIREAALLNEKGTVVCSTTAGAKGKNHSRSDFFSWARKPESQGKIRMWYEKTGGPHNPVNPGSPAPPRIELFLGTPLYRESAVGGHQRPGGKFAGALMFTVDVEKMLAERSPLLAPATKLHTLWIMTREGTLLVHSGHPEMVMNNIRKRDKTCNECHTSFDYLGTILAKTEGAIEYQIKGEPKKVAAFTSMAFDKTSWIVVMNAPLDEVTAFESDNLRNTFFLLGAVVFLLGLAFFFAYRNYRQKVAGEMEVKRLQENHALMEKLRKTLGGTIQVISSAVEMRDPYTAGHQTRVADLARAIATEMGISPDRTDFIRVACTIHDIGKISVPAEILSKPTKLSDIEFSLIKAHAQAGYDILKNIEFPWPVAEVILQHHERMDGSGYPRNLKGEDICIEARILTVADVMEAMASHRPYRPGLGIDAALNEIEKNSGIFYDKIVSDACIRLFREKGFKLGGLDYK